jgi:hypothetical protein
MANKSPVVEERPPVAWSMAMTLGVETKSSTQKWRRLSKSKSKGRSKSKSKGRRRRRMKTRSSRKGRIHKKDESEAKAKFGAVGATSQKGRAAASAAACLPG